MNIRDFTLATDEDTQVWEATPRSYLLKPETLTPYEAYLVLKESFGKSNSDDFDEFKSQWAYLLKFDKGFIHINDWKLWTWSIAVHLFDGSEEAGRKIAEDFLKQITHLAQRVRSRVKAVATNPQAYIIQNPFILYYETATELLRFAHLETANWSESKEAQAIAAARFQFSSKPAFYRSALLLLLASFDGLLNLIYELYLKRQLRDERIYERLSREQIDIKLRLAPIYCDCFSDQPIDPAVEEFRNLQTLVNLRNDFVHANLTKSMIFPLITEDKVTFVVTQFEKEVSIYLPRNFGELDEQHLQIAKQIIDNAIKLILQHMNPRYRKEFIAVMNDENISVEYDNGELVII